MYVLVIQCGCFFLPISYASVCYLQYAYVLRSMLLHCGSTATYGHYVVHKQQHDDWYCYSDNQVTVNGRLSVFTSMQHCMCLHAQPVRMHAVMQSTVIYTVSQTFFTPLNCLYVCQIFTDLLNICTAEKHRKFTTKPI